MDYRKIITIEPGKRGGKPCIRGLRITVECVLKLLGDGYTAADIVREYPELAEEDVYQDMHIAPRTVMFRSHAVPSPAGRSRLAGTNEAPQTRAGPGERASNREPSPPYPLH